MKLPATAVPALAEVLSKLAGDADAWEAGGHVPDEIVDLLRPTGVLGAVVPRQAGGTGWGLTRYTEACQQLARLSISAQALLTTHGMVCHSLHRWRNADLLPVLEDLVTGRCIGAFALTDQTAGSDVSALDTRASRADDGGWRLDGVKRWVTFGQLAEVFLVFAASTDGDVCLVVRPDDPGVQVVPEIPTSGFRGARLAQLRLVDARVPRERMLGRPRFALVQVAVRALGLGRLCVAAGAVGLAERAFDELLTHTSTRQQFGKPLLDLPVVRNTVGTLAVDLEAARLAVAAAARRTEDGAPGAESAVLTAKLAATRAASAAARACAHLHGAYGLVLGSPVDRWVADARVLEVIEGNSELVTDLLATQAVADWRVRRSHGEAS